MTKDFSKNGKKRIPAHANAQPQVKWASSTQNCVAKTDDKYRQPWKEEDTPDNPAWSKEEETTIKPMLSDCANQKPKTCDVHFAMNGQAHSCLHAISFLDLLVFRECFNRIGVLTAA